MELTKGEDVERKTSDVHDEIFQKFVRNPYIPDDNYEYIYRIFLKDVIGFLLGQIDSITQIQKYFGSIDQSKIFDWYQQFCKQNRIIDDIVDLRRLLILNEKWPNIRRILRNGDKIVSIPFFETLKIDPDADNLAHNLMVRAVKEITATLSGEIETVSPVMQKSLGVKDISEVINWFHRFCAANNIREDFISLYYQLCLGQHILTICRRLQNK